MKYESAAAMALAVAALAAAGGCDKKEVPPKAAAPAAIANPVTEGGLSTITLTPEAEARLGVTVVTATMESVAGTRTVAGEVIVPPGRSVIVSAPIAGTIQAASLPRAGERVQQGQTLFTVFPVSSGERDQRVIAERDVASASAELQAAEQRLARLESLLKDGAASSKAVEEARAQRDVLAAASTAGRNRVENMQRSVVGTRGEIAVRSPFAGIVQDVQAAPGQTVAAGVPLFAVAQVDALWIKVPVYVGDRNSIDTTQPIAVSSLAGGGAVISAIPVAAPSSANALTATTDLFYASPAVAPLRAGERVNVQLPLRSSRSALIIPTAAVVYDMQGGTWVYEARGSHKFVRRRIDVAEQISGKTVVGRGLSAGQKIVTIGAAELFGTEFGPGK